MKNIIICSDGTWQSPESDTSTHILRIARGIPNRALGDHAGQWLAREAEACGLAFEPHFLDNLAPDHTGPQHNEYKGFYRAMRRRIVREVEPVVHVSVRRRWEDDGVSYRSPALRGLLENVGGDWGKIQVIF